MAKRPRTVLTPGDDAPLSPSSAALYEQLTAEYSIRDAGGLAILRTGLLARDRALLCEAQIAQDGQTFNDRWGQLRPHPLLNPARDARAAWLSALRMLNLAIGEPPKMGRPASDV